MELNLKEALGMSKKGEIVQLPKNDRKKAA